MPERRFAMASSSSPPPAPARRPPWWLAAALVAVVGVAALALLRERWQLRLADVRLVDHREKVSGGGAAVIVTGYVVVRVEGDVDLFRLAREADTYPVVRATLCDSGRPLGAWRDPFPVERDAAARRFVYAVLVPARGRDGELAQATGDVCLRFQPAGANVLAPLASTTLVVPLGAALREELAAYRRRDGVVDLTLDPGCAPRLCQPE
jgi:hypothetical protein